MTEVNETTCKIGVITRKTVNDNEDAANKK